MSIYTENKVKKIFIGSTKAKEAHLGSTKIWAATTQTSVPTKAT